MFSSLKFGRGKQSHWEQEQSKMTTHDQKLAGVGIVLFMAPDQSLFVKSLVEGSGACNSGIMPGDCLMEVDGKNVYCKGTEAATKLILGAAGTVCTLKFSRVDQKTNKRVPVTANLMRELKATKTPQFNVLQQNENVKQQQVFLQCLQGEQQDAEETESEAESSSGEDESDEENQEEEEEEDQELEEERASVKSSDPMEGVTENDEPNTDAKEKRADRKVLFKGKWYTESEIEQMEKQAKSVKDEIARMEAIKNGAGVGELGVRKRELRKSRANSFGGALVAQHGSGKKKKAERSASVGGSMNHTREVLGPTLFGDSPPLKRDSPHAGEDQRMASDPKALSAGIWVVEGGQVQKDVTWLGGTTRKTIPLKISTGGLLSWGKSGTKEGHVMWAKASSSKYDPKMSKAEFSDMNKRFFVMLEGEQVVAHSALGGKVGATEAKEPLEFVALSEEDRDKWVLGISMVLCMAREEAKVRQQKQARSNPEYDQWVAEGGKKKAGGSFFVTSPVRPPAGAPTSPAPEATSPGGVTRPHVHVGDMAGSASRSAGDVRAVGSGGAEGEGRQGRSQSLREWGGKVGQDLGGRGRMPSLRSLRSPGARVGGGGSMELAALQAGLGAQGGGGTPTNRGFDRRELSGGEGEGARGDADAAPEAAAPAPHGAKAEEENAARNSEAVVEDGAGEGGAGEGGLWAARGMGGGAMMTPGLIVVPEESVEREGSAYVTPVTSPKEGGGMEQVQLYKEQAKTAMQRLLS